MKNLKLFKNVICNVILGLVVISVIAVSFASGVITVSGGLKPTNKGSSKINVAFMVGIYQETEYIESMLNIFEQNGVTVTFFVGGSWSVRHEDVLKKIYSKGHEIGSYGYYNKDHKTLSQQRSQEEISISHALVKDILGIEMGLFTPPFGSYNDDTLKNAQLLGYKTIMPTNDTMDWRDEDKTLIYNRAIKNVSGGTLILMHPTYATIDALGDIIHKIKDKGYNITSVSKALQAEMI